MGAVSLGVLLLGILTGCLHKGGGSASTPPSPPPAGVPVPVQIERTVAPDPPRVGEPFTVTLNVTVQQDLPAVLIMEVLGGLTLLEIQEGFSLEEKGVLKGVILQPTAGTTQTFRYRARCERPIPYTLVAQATTKGFDPVYTVATVTCSE